MGLIIPNSFASKNTAQLSDLDGNFLYLKNTLDPYVDNIIVDESGQVTIDGGIVADLTGNVSGNSDNVTGTVAVTNGGTGLTTLTANNVILGNGTSNPIFVAPNSSGNVLTSNVTTWQSVAPAPTLGVGQAWQIVSRAFNITYTNSTGKPIMLAGVFARNAVSTAYVNLTIGGVQVPLARNSNSSGGNVSAGSLIIPVDATYELVNVGESLSSYTIYELR